MRARFNTTNEEPSPKRLVFKIITFLGTFYFFNFFVIRTLWAMAAILIFGATSYGRTYAPASRAVCQVLTVKNERHGSPVGTSCTCLGMALRAAGAPLLI